MSVFSKDQTEKWDRVNKLRAQIDEMLGKAIEPNSELLIEYAGLVGPNVYNAMEQRIAYMIEQRGLMRLVNEARGVSPDLNKAPADLTNRLLAAILLKLHGKSLT